MKFDYRYLFGLAGMLAVISCNSSNSTGSGGGTGPVLINLGSYSDNGAALVITTPATTDYSCNGTTLVTRTRAGSTFTVPYTLSGNTLTVYTPDGAGTVLPSGAVVDYAEVYTGGNGTGLQGTWTFSDATYLLVSGTLTAQDYSQITSELANIRDNGTGNTIQFSGNSITTLQDANTAQDFLDGNWNPPRLPNAALYNVTVVATGKYTVRMTGVTTGEIVTLTLSPNGDVTYSSSVSANTTFHYFDQPTSCPNNDQPDWYVQFLAANVK